MFCAYGTLHVEYSMYIIIGLVSIYIMIVIGPECMYTYMYIVINLERTYIRCMHIYIVVYIYT